jgi:hypothetical protein
MLYRMALHDPPPVRYIIIYNLMLHVVPLSDPKILTDPALLIEAKT